MKNPDRKTVSQLEELPNIGKAMAGDLHLIGIQHPKDLVDKNACQPYDDLCSITGEKHDPCVIDVFLSVINFMAGGKARPWWEFTTKRKKRKLSENGR
ncbi:MAG TPA: mitomycin resistance protein [Desulfobulbaceae bacterium]|nr:mitomycin resistance protein [Desulfobulbaceae bacterium]